MATWAWSTTLSAAVAALALTAVPAAAAKPDACPPMITLDGPGGDANVNRIGTILDALHVFAAIPNGESYFALFAPDAVFIGTDAGERWTLAQFRAYAEPHFKAGRGWVYKPRERHVTIGPGGQVAWFDELLDSASYGTARGTGVMVVRNCEWKLAQYALTFPIPNDLAKEMTGRIKAYEAKAP
jgi:hypothetical protein